ncbi:MAG: hypothetical protein M3416_10715, partial [Acidobacteriota bacterium]|nr:hypothetical protein [Acidobacteriota bacterium]
MRSDDVPPGAFRLYAYYCMRRDHATGTCFPSVKRAQADLHFKSYSYASEMRKELLNEGWIEFTEDGQVRPLLGFGVREKPKQVSEISETTGSEKTEDGFGENRSGVREKPKQVSEISEPLIKDEPAPLTSPFNQPPQP